jgi:hypothetical protein
MGINEKGLAIGNFDVTGLIINWEYQSDGSSGSEDNDMKIPLGSFSTVSDAAWWLAYHAYFGHGRQWGIISSEEGVGAIVAVDTHGHSNITWINNTYAAFANAYYCDGKIDPDGTDARAKQLIDDIVINGTSSEGDHLINWQDVCQRLAKDTNDKEDGTGNFSYVSEISNQLSYSAMVAISGNLSYNNSLSMTWVNIGITTQIGIFLPITAAYLQSAADIPSNFTEGDGIQPYVDAKFQYASVESDMFNCSRVREIQEYAFYNENLTFQWFDDLMGTIMNAADETEAKDRLRTYVETAIDTALSGYVNNRTISINITNPEKGLYINNKKVLPLTLLPFLPTIVIKSIEVEATLLGGGTVDRVEFLLDGDVKSTDTTPPYTWLWTEKTPSPFRHNLTVVLSTTEGYQVSDEMIVYKFL